MNMRRSSRMAAVQEQLDRKAGKQKTIMPKDVNGKKKDWDWFEDKLGANVLTALLIIAGAIVFYVGLYSPKGESPSLTGTGSWVWRHWLAVLAFSGILALLIARIAGGATKTLQWFLAGTLFFLFIVLPVWFWIVGTGTSSAMRSSPRSEIPLASAPQSTWPKLELPPVVGGKSASIPVPPDMDPVMAGYNFHLRAVYQDGTECSYGENCSAKPMSLIYAVNEKSEANVIAYAFAQK